jgi:hypothetical protein
MCLLSTHTKVVPTKPAAEVEAEKVVERMTTGEASIWEVGKCALSLGAQETMAATRGVGIGGSDLIAERRAAGCNEGDRVGVLLDLDEGSLSFFKNGVKHSTCFAGVTGPVVHAVQLRLPGHSCELVLRPVQEWPHCGSGGGSNAEEYGEATKPLTTARAV